MSELSILELTKQAEVNARRAVSWMDVCNLFAEHIHYVRGNAEQDAFEHFWANRDDICYMVGGAGFSGRQAVKGYLVDCRAQRKKTLLPLLAKTYPDVKDDPAYLGYADHDFHSLVNPFVQVAGDNQTAKGVWWAPGIVGYVSDELERPLDFSALIYLVDFIREDDGWKIWHLRELEEFSFQTRHFHLGMGMGTTLHAGDPDKPTQGPMPGGLGNEDGGHGPGGPPIPSKEAVAQAIAENRSAGGRTGEALRSYYGQSPASPAMHKNPEGFVDAGQINDLGGISRVIADVVAPYETWDDSIGVMRTYLNYFPDYDLEIAQEKANAAKEGRRPFYTS